ncbi:MAG TPA: MaoC family dehydratase [Casimicrobiaceae bacterium]|nr:MaoC family dehydratase [Casimicrobiaceae bacterium]
MSGALSTVGERFAERVAFDEASIREFARLCADFNPLHHDAAYAARSPFGTLIASGPHVTSRLMALTATYYSQRCQPLGLGFTFRFVRAVPAGVTLDLQWDVTGVEGKASLAGDIVTLDGRAIDDDGVVYVTGHGSLLLRERHDGPAAPC